MNKQYFLPGDLIKSEYDQVFFAQTIIVEENKFVDWFKDVQRARRRACVGIVIAMIENRRCDSYGMYVLRPEMIGWEYNLEVRHSSETR